MLTTRNLTVAIFAPTAGQPIEGATVTAILDRGEVDNGYIVQRRVTAVTDENGEATLSLWPNSRGSGESRYVLFAVDADRRGLFEVSLNMPDEDCNLWDVAGPPLGDIDPTTSLLERLQSIRNDVINGGATRGESAYEIAVRNGFEGTEAEWLASLVPTVSGYMPMPPTTGGPYVATAGGEWVEVDTAPDTPLSVTASDVTTADTTPELTGTVSNPGAVISIELVARDALTVTADNLNTPDTTPEITGTVSDPEATVSIEVIAA